MNPPDMRSLDQQLLAAQQVDQTLRQRYEKEIANMLEQKLNTTRKASFIISIIISTVMMVALTIAAVSTPKLPAAARVGLGLGALYAAGWLVLSVRVLRRGAVHLRKDSMPMSALPWLFTVALMTVLMFATGAKADSVRSVWMLLYGLTFLLMASVFLIQYSISDARLKVEERLLEMQLRIAELSEQIRKQS